MKARRQAARTSSASAVLRAAMTPLLEKNAGKALTGRAVGTRMVFSMARVIVLAFAVAMLHQIWLAGIAGWPDATLSIAVVLAMPVLGAMERVRPGQVLDLTKVLLNRFGEGAVRGIGPVYPTEPSKYDDHRDDASA